MKRAMAVGVAAVLTTALSVTPALAQRFDGRGGQRVTTDRRAPTMMHGRPGAAWSIGPRQIDSRLQTPRSLPIHRGGASQDGPPQHGRPPHHGGSRHPGLHHHGGFGGGFVNAWPAVYYRPGYVDSSPSYAEPPPYDTPAYVPAPPSVVISPPPPAPTVVEHPTGRYELRGDGLAMPYTWVWVPNPPAAPPAPAAPPPASTPAETAPPRRSTLYSWTDREGVVHWTDNFSSVPQEYRGKVQKRSL